MLFEILENIQYRKQNEKKSHKYFAKTNANTIAKGELNSIMLLSSIFRFKIILMIAMISCLEKKKHVSTNHYLYKSFLQYVQVKRNKFRLKGLIKF